MQNHARFAIRLAGPVIIGLALAVSGCATPDTAGMAMAPMPAGSATLPADATAAMIASGDAIFHASSCIACHGPDAKGTAVGPDLTDATWLTGDGSIGAITTIVSEGVDAPKQFRSPMPAMGGANLSDDDIKAVATYVWSLSHK